MNMEDLIYSRLEECHVMFPSYNERSTDDLAVLAKLFTRRLAGWSQEDIDAAFDDVLSGSAFPVLGDILAFKDTQRIYRFPYGPNMQEFECTGDHWYVKDQIRRGTDVEQYAMTVPVKEARAAQLSSQEAVKPLDWDSPDEERLPGSERTGRGNGGWKQIGYRGFDFGN